MNRSAKQKNSLPPNTAQAIPRDVAERLRQSGIKLPGAQLKKDLPTKAATLPPRPTSTKPIVGDAKKAVNESAIGQGKPALKNAGTEKTSELATPAPPAQAKSPASSTQVKVKLPELPARKAILSENEAIKIIQEAVPAKGFNFTESAAKETYNFWHTLSNAQRSSLNVNDYYELGKKFYLQEVAGLVALGKAILLSLETNYQNQVAKQAGSETAKDAHAKTTVT